MFCEDDPPVDFWLPRRGASSPLTLVCGLPRGWEASSILFASGVRS